MKSNEKKIKVPLHFISDDNYLLFGIISTEPDYKLSLLINKKFHISLKNQPPLEVRDNGGVQTFFGKFSDYSGAPETSYNLIANKSGNSFLLKKMKNYDYLFLIQDSNNNINADIFIQKMREAGIFRAVYPINLGEVNKKYMEYLMP
jgi:hypothetical protein